MQIYRETTSTSHRLFSPPWQPAYSLAHLGVLTRARVIVRDRGSQIHIEESGVEALGRVDLGLSLSVRLVGDELSRIELGPAGVVAGRLVLRVLRDRIGRGPSVVTAGSVLCILLRVLVPLVLSRQLVSRPAVSCAFLLGVSRDLGM